MLPELEKQSWQWFMGHLHGDSLLKRCFFFHGCSSVKWSLSPGWSISPARWSASCWTTSIMWPFVPSSRGPWWSSSSGLTSAGCKVGHVHCGRAGPRTRHKWAPCVSAPPPENTRRLKHLCRLQIRRCLGRSRLRSPVFMSFLPLPGRLRDYILYREYDMHGQKSGISGGKK